MEHGSGWMEIETSVEVGLQRACIWKEATNSLPLLEARVNSAVPLFAFSKPYTINTEGAGNYLMADVINIYTDGSKTKMGSGCGVYTKSLKLNLSHRASVN